MSNEPAFPTHDVNGYDHPGLTKLEYFAGLAMQARVGATLSKRDEIRRNNAAASVADAKALLSALEKESNGKG